MNGHRQPAVLTPCSGRAFLMLLRDHLLTAGLERWHLEHMKQRSLLQRLGAYLMGLVDEYWTMREPRSYGQEAPSCTVRCDDEHCERAD